MGSPPPPLEMNCGFLIQLVLCKKETMWFIGVEVEQETSAPPPKKILDLPLLHTFTFLFHNSNYGNRAVQGIGIVPASSNFRLKSK